MNLKSCCTNKILCAIEENRKQWGHMKLISSEVSHAAEILSCCALNVLGPSELMLLLSSSPPFQQFPVLLCPLLFFARLLLLPVWVSLLPVFVFLSLFLLSEFALFSPFYVCLYLWGSLSRSLYSDMTWKGSHCWRNYMQHLQQIMSEFSLKLWAFSIAWKWSCIWNHAATLPAKKSQYRR